MDMMVILAYSVQYGPVSQVIDLLNPPDPEISLTTVCLLNPVNDLLGARLARDKQWSGWPQVQGDRNNGVSNVHLSS